MKIKAYLRTKLAEPFQGKHYHEAGTEVVMNAKTTTKNLGTFFMVPPDPVSLNLNNAYNLIQKSNKIKERLGKSKSVQIFPKKYSTDQIEQMGLNTPEQVLAIDPDAEVVRELDTEKMYELLQSGTDAMTALITAVESFVNAVLPYDCTAIVKNKIGERVVLTKNEIVRRFSIIQKLELLSEFTGKEDFKSQNSWLSFIRIKELRDEFIHFKKMDKNINEIWTFIIVGLVDSDLQKFYEDTVFLIQYFKPNYFD